MDLAEFFASNKIEGWRRAAEGWATWVLILPVLCVLLGIGVKWLLEVRARGKGIGGQTTKGPTRSRQALLVCFILLCVAIFGVWLASRDFRSVVGLSGLGKGLLISWIVLIAGFLLGLMVKYRGHMPWKPAR